MTRRLTGALRAVPLVLVLAVAGCGGKKRDNNGVATAGGGSSGSPRTSASAAMDNAELQRQFARCMRDNGVDVADPTDGRGGFTVQGGASGGPGVGGPDSKFQKAMDKCKQYLPNGGLAATLDPAQQEQVRQYAKCMRENGVPKFPDPQPNGGLMIGSDSGLNPDDPAFKAADEKCRHFMPGRPGGADGGGTQSRRIGG
jgi:hypothetical protein